MRTTLNIDHQLLEEAMSHNTQRTKTQVINEALRAYVRGKRQKELLDLRGKLAWEGNIDELRKRC